MNDWFDKDITTDVNLNIICSRCGKKLLDCKCSSTDNTEYFSKVN